ncbi:MAG: NAD/NADP transhydrogenase beta subunit [uncultured archaeon A07HR67]|nr:MAG: NAD/NADP transhydrogenase beta subunit [uncultured archaeon A07HR67]
MLSVLPESMLRLAYLAAAVLFIQGLRDMTHPRTAVRGNLISAAGMFVAVAVTLLWFEVLSPIVLIAGLVVGGLAGSGLAMRVEMTQMPQLVGVFNGFGGGASALVAGAELVQYQAESGGAFPTEMAVAAAASGIIGAVTLFGSTVAAGKLHGVITGSAIRYTGEQAVKILVLAVAVFSGILLVVQPDVLPAVLRGEMVPTYWVLVATASVLGVLLVIPIGGADMPVVIALLNAYSGLAPPAPGSCWRTPRSSSPERSSARPGSSSP